MNKYVTYISDEDITAIKNFWENKYSKPSSPLKREETNFPTGWICPKCGRVHAPHISGCSCYMWHQPYQPWQPWQPWQPPIVWC